MRYFLACLVSLAVFVGPAAAEPPEINIPESQLDETLTPSHKSQIEASFNYYADMIRNAKDGEATGDEAVRKGLAGLLETYRYSDKLVYRYTAAQIASETVTPLLDLDTNYKQVNAALALSRMSQVTIQPALEKMIIHQNPAVRYLGWQGYDAIWLRILSRDLKSAEKMFDSLAKRARLETSGPVMSVIWRILRPRVDVVSEPKELGDLRELGMKILSESWHVRCREVMLGNYEVINAARTGLDTAKKYAIYYTISNNLSDEAKKQAIQTTVQMIVDLMWCTGKAYKTACDADMPVDLISHASEMLLRDCEKSLNELLELGLNDEKDYIRFPLRNTSTTVDRGSAVMYYVHPDSGKKYGVLAWVDDLKKKFDIRIPSEDMFKTNRATTAPAE